MFKLREERSRDFRRDAIAYGILIKICSSPC